MVNFTTNESNLCPATLQFVRPTKNEARGLYALNGFNSPIEAYQAMLNVL
jgi:hypothetical protein